MSLGLFNCRLIQPAGDQLFFFAGCLASSGKLFSLFVTHPARPRPAGGRSMLLVFPSQKGFVWVCALLCCFVWCVQGAGTAPVGCRRLPPIQLRIPALPFCCSMYCRMML